MAMAEEPNGSERPSSPITAYVKPQPRPPKSPAHSAQIRIQNRRREYLERHPAYFDSLEHELADPLLYDALIRRFQSAAEREQEGRAKGYSRVLEVDLLRGEAKLSQLAAHPELHNPHNNNNNGAAALSASARDRDVFIGEYAGALFSSSDEAKTTTSQQRQAEEGRARWRDFLRRRFVLGRDEDFDYAPVDEDDALDVLERREQEDAWFDDEEPAWDGSGSATAAGGVGGGDGGDEGGGDGGRKKTVEGKVLEGETGVQDF
ncbi:coiled-coil domain-containing protein-domain-containing protein [Xylariaceae sp. FL0662B]|nr:coiled-coil domain-containing protein-domain-containing protein [Xylariaceae sp. FL0662B]